MGLAFVTANEYHDIEPWELFEEDGTDRIAEKEITLIDINDYMKQHILEENYLLMSALKEHSEILLGRTVKALESAKDAHLKVESMYIPNMNFTRISALTEELYNELVEI